MDALHRKTHGHGTPRTRISGEGLVAIHRRMHADDDVTETLRRGHQALHPEEVARYLGAGQWLGDVVNRLSTVLARLRRGGRRGPALRDPSRVGRVAHSQTSRPANDEQSDRAA